MLYRRPHLGMFVLALMLLWACGDNNDTVPADAGVDADTSECAGKPDGAACGNTADSECDRADTCQAGMCVQNIAPANTACGDSTASECDFADTCDGAGACVPNHVAAATACGDATASECDLADTCDGAGACAPNHVAAATACGDSTTGECDLADTCDGAGACAPNHVAADTACGDSSAGECDLADTCDGAGACAPNHVAADTACGDSTTGECDLADTCDGAGACAPNHVAASTACGDSTTGECDLADTCDGAGACAPNYVAANTACGDPTATDCDLADICNGAGACEPNLPIQGTACYDCAAGPGQCAECDGAALCGDAPVCVEPPGQALSTTFAGGNNHRGNMFDVTAVNDLVITGFDAHPMGNTTIEVYYKVGTYAGSETNAAAWTLIGSAAVIANPFGTATPVPVPARVTIPAGATYAFYVTSTTQAVSLNYSNGTAAGAVYASDANLQIREGVGLEYPFTMNTGAIYSPRVWNGVVHYRLVSDDSTLAMASSTYGGGTAHGVMFDVIAAADVQLRDRLDVELTAGTHTVDVYFRRGSFVGHETSVAGWERIGGISSIVSPGDGTRSSMPLLDQIHLSAGETIGLYIDTGPTDAGLRTDSGGSVGDTAASNTELTIEVGSANPGIFGAPGAATMFRGVLAYPVCVVQP